MLPGMPLTRSLPRWSLFGIALIMAVVVRAEPIKVLYFTKSSGYEHSVVKWGEGGAPSHSEQVLARLGAEHDLAFTFSKDGSLFSADYLAGFDVVVFYTSGNLQRVGTDGNPAMTAAGKQALLDWVKGGGGFMALHAGGDTFHTGENYEGNPPQGLRAGRYECHGEDSDPYVLMLGGEFINHGPQQTATARIIDPSFPGYGDWGASITVHEEWYSLKELSESNHVLLVLETAGMKGSDYDRPDYPIAWARHDGEGRVCYHAMGHREDVWDAAYYQSMLVGAIEWLGGRVEVELRPNLLEVAPGALQLPPPRS